MAIKILASMNGIVNDENGNPFYQVNYRLSEPTPNGHIDGQVLIAFDGYTETEVNALIQSAIATKATAESSGTATFTTDDVRGGRI